MIVPDDEICIQNMLGLDIIPKDIEDEYMVRARMLHRQLSGGPIGPVAVVDMLRALGHGPPAAAPGDSGKPTVWRTVDVDTAIELSIDGEWKCEGHTFQGEVGGGTLAVKVNGRIDEYPAWQVRISDRGLPSDVDKLSFEKPANTERIVGDARVALLDENNEVEIKNETSEISAEEPPMQPQLDKVNWGTVKKGTGIWYRDGEDVFDAEFQRCVKDGMAVIKIEGEAKSRSVERTKLLMP